MKKLLLILLLLLFPQLITSQEVRTALVKDSGKQVYRCDLGANADEVSIDLETSPKVSFSKWNKENSLSIKIPAGLINYTAPTIKDSKTIEIGDSKTGFYFNRFDDENFKFGLILYEKPATNTWSFQLEGWEEFDFLYQPPLKNVNPDGSTWEGGTPDKQECIRPANVSGSWAIYHKTKKWQAVGQIDYGCGKFGHIYNVLLTDADGKTLRIIPDIKDGIYTITCPQDFLDKAKYPIKANDEFGNTGVGGTPQTYDAQYDGMACRFEVVAPAGTLNYLSQYLSSAATRTAKYALYDTSAGSPNVLKLSDASAFNVGTAAGWYINTVDYNFTMVAGTTYWATGMLMSSGGTLTYYYDTDAAYLRIYFDYNTSPGYFPNPFSNATYTSSATRRVSIKATYTPTAAVNTLLTNCSLTNAGLRAQ